MNDDVSPARSGTILLICISLISAMVAISFAYVLSMRTAADLGPSTKVLGLARQAAQSGTAHACEMLIRDYLERPLSPTSDAAAHRIFFDAIDNVIPQAPRETSASSAKDSKLWNDNDVNPLSKNINGYRTFTAHTGRIYDASADCSWLGNLVTSSTPRYIEPMYFSTSASIESSSSKTDFTKVPSSAPDINTPIYFDSRWQPTVDRTQARYRLRYAVWCEDLSGHVFVGLPGPFTRGDPLAADGALVAAGKNNQGTEMDRAWAMRYAPQLNPMFLDFETSSPDGLLGEGAGLQAYLAPWIGTGLDSGSYHSWHTSGFSTAGVMLGSSPWAWRNSGSNLTGVKLGSPWHPLGSTIVHRVTGKRFSFQMLNDVSGDRAMYNGGLTVPYGAPTRWDRNPDPETVDTDTLAYNEGPTDCPWRINVLTAPANTLRAMFTGFRPSYSWEHELTWMVKFLWSGWSGTTPVWIIPASIPFAYPHITKLATPKRSQLGVPDPFRAGFLTKDRVSGAINRRPFAQFLPSPSADNPRAQMDPSYPSPVTANYREDIGRFYDLERDGAWFRRGNGQAGPCVPRLDSARRLPILHSVTTFSDIYTTGSMPDATSVYKVPEYDMEVYYAFDPWNRTNTDLDGDGFNDPSSWRWPREARPTLWNANSYLLDALSALASSAAVAIAAHQPTTPYPAQPADGGDAMFAGKWGSGPTLDTDTDSDGYKDGNSVITNVADIDRLFLLILGEDPYAPGSNPLTRSAVYASTPGGSNSFTPTASYGNSPYIPCIVGMPAYDPTKRDYSNYFDAAPEQWKQCPFVSNDATKYINLRRASLLGLRRGIYANAESGLHPDNATPHLDDANALKSEAAALIQSGASYATSDITKAKHRQLMRCRLRDAERIVNDMRMSFFGANVRYRDRTRAGHPSRGRFRPYDLDGDGWAICSAYCPSDVIQVGVRDKKDNKVGYRVTEPTDWSKVVFDTYPDNPNQIDSTHVLADTSGPVWVCFKDVDPATIGAALTNDTTTSDFKDLLTYSSDDDTDSGPFPGGAFGIPASRSGFTRWFYPAVRVENATATDVIDGVAAYAPDTYFSLTGYFTMEKSHFYRMITRGEVWDEWRRLVLDSVLLETVFMLDPDGNVPMKSALKPLPIDPVTSKITNGTGIEDSCIIYQRWLKDHYAGSRNRSAASP